MSQDFLNMSTNVTWNLREKSLQMSKQEMIKFHHFFYFNRAPKYLKFVIHSEMKKKYQPFSHLKSLPLLLPQNITLSYEPAHEIIVLII